MIEKVNMSPVIMEKIMVTKGPVNLIALKNKDCAASISRHLPCKEEQVKPASRNSKDQKRLLNDPIVLGARYVAVLIVVFLGL